MVVLLTKFCTNFLFVFWPTLASVPEYPKYLGMDIYHSEPERPPPDTVTTKCIKLFFGAIFDSIRFGIVTAIIYWFFKSFIFALSDILFYIVAILCSVLVYLIIYGLAVLFGNKSGILPFSPEFSRRRIWSWSIKSRPITDCNKKTVPAPVAITEEDEMFYMDLRKNLRRRKEEALEREYQERLKDSYLNHNKTRRVVTRVSLPTKQHKPTQQIFPVIPTTVGAPQRQREVPADSPPHSNLTNFLQQENCSANNCPNSDACECKIKEVLLPQEETVAPVEKPAPAKKHVNFQETDESEEKSNKNLEKKASQHMLRNDNDEDKVERINQQETNEAKMPEIDEPVPGIPKIENPVRNRKVLTPILKQRSNYQQQHRERKRTPPASSSKTKETSPTHTKLYSVKTNKNVKFEKQKPKRE